MVLLRPFDEAKENINTSLSEVAFAAATLLIPLLVIETHVALAGDLMIYILMGSTILNGLVSALFLIPMSVKLYRKYCKKGHTQVKEEYVKTDNGKEDVV